MTTMLRRTITNPLFAATIPRQGHPPMLRSAVALLVVIIVGVAPSTHAQTHSAGWYAYGGDAGGTRYAPHDQITPENVHRLEVAWTIQTGEVGAQSPVAEKLTFEATPILFEERLYVSTAFGEIIALDAATGKVQWRYDPQVDRTINYSELASRGVSLWSDSEAEPGAACRARILIGTIDARLIAIDARTGTPCSDFGDSGQIDLADGFSVGDNPQYVDYQITSPPAVVGDIIVVGSSIGDNWRTDTGSGAVRAFHARTGELRWTWEPFSREVGRAGAANAWSIISADPERELVFVPTGSPSPDFYGGLRLGDNEHANSVVALRASTGERMWSFQTVHHDLWDYDIAAQPALVSVTRDGQSVAAVAQATKMGSLFLLNRDTGEPLFPVEERSVPQTDVPGEESSPTQPFPLLPRTLMPQGPLTPEEAWGINDADRSECRTLIERYRNEGIFTPPSLQGTILYPGNGAGTNWGSVAYDPAREWLVLTTSRLATLVQLLPRDSLDAERARPDSDEWEISAQRDAPFAMKRRTLVSSSGFPCNPPPWGTLAAVDLNSGDVVWEVPIGDHGDRSVGLPNGGGPIVTGSGLIFLGATMDNRFRAFDLDSGEVLWQTDLPLSAISTPMTYELADGRQYVVIAAGGHGKMGLPTGDHLVAFALPQEP